LILAGCTGEHEEQGASGKEKADLIVVNGRVYTVDSTFSMIEAFAIVDGKFAAVGTSEEIQEKYDGPIEDLNGAAVYPGFIDAHCHFLMYGEQKMQVDLKGSKSFDEVLDRIKEYQDLHEKEWILGRGWDQTRWENKELPNKTQLDELFPDVPVFIQRVDGHLALVNQKALELAGIWTNTQVEGGRIETQDGKLTGILTDNAMALVLDIIPELTLEESKEALRLAQKDCFGVGLTTVDDAGLDLDKIQLIEQMQNSGDLFIRIYAMVKPEDDYISHFTKEGRLKTKRLNVRSFKVYADGSLGSRGALLKQPYADDVETHGDLLTPEETIWEYALRFNGMGFQMNTHCIGDSANKFLLAVNEEILPDMDNRRWRIEHCQVVSRDDMDLFKVNGIIPSVQPTHATSDMVWAADRLGDERMAGAYAYKSLLQKAGLIVMGSDFPVENINPLYGFYAAVARRDHNGQPAEGFLIDEALSREEALKAMTIWAAYANFEEFEKGSIEPGKLADFVVLDGDIMVLPIGATWQIGVLRTYVGGELVYKK
jgi:predicted amidohydrolase YtcJ